MRCALFLALFACESDPGDKPDDSGGPDDTGEETGLPPDMGFDLDGAWSGATLTLTWLDVRSLGTETIVFGDTLLSLPASSDPLALVAGAPPEADLIEADPETAPGMMVAIYVPALHVDTDGDGARSGDEVYVGAGTWWPTWISGPIPASYVSAGAVEGWNALYVLSGEGPSFGDPLAVPLSAAQDDTLTLGGRFDGDPDGRGLVLIPGVSLEGGTVASYAYDAPMLGAWSIALDGAPPADHLQDLEWLGAPGALELPVAYTDGDASGGFSGGDTPLWAACHDGVAVAAIWSPGATDLWTALTMAMQGTSAGWFAMTVGDGGGTVLDDAEAAALVMDEACVLGE